MSLIGFFGGADRLRGAGGTIVSAFTSGATATTQLAGSYVTGGFPPYTIAWTGATANVRLSTSATTSPEVNIAGLPDSQHIGVFVLVATDQKGEIVTASVAYDYTKGTP